MKILQLEGHAIPDKHGHLETWIKKQKGDTKFIGNAYKSGKEIAKVIDWPNILAFTSTFLYVDSMAALLSKVLIPLRKEPLTIVMNGYEIDDSITKLIEHMSYEWITEGYDKVDGRPIGYEQVNEAKADAIAYSMRHFTLMELVSYAAPLRPIEVLKARIERETSRLKFEDDYQKAAPIRPTGRKIKIGNLASVVGKEWSQLVPDSIVDEVDMSMMDPRPGSGVWVMGLTAPVKLIGRFDQRGYNEYEIIS